MIKLGEILTLSAVIGVIYTPGREMGMFLGLGLMLLMIASLIIRVERAKKINCKKVQKKLSLHFGK